MDYTLNMGPWNSVFAVPTALVDRYLRLAGKEQLQVLLWMLRHSGERISPEKLAQELGMDTDSAMDAVDYLEGLGVEEVSAREDALLRRAEDGLRAIDGVEVLGAPARRAGAVSFNLKDFHYYDTARLLDQLGIAVRSGHHCAQPLLERFGLTGAVRVTPAWYNTEEEIAALLRGVERVAALAGGLKA